MQTERESPTSPLGVNINQQYYSGNFKIIIVESSSKVSQVIIQITDIFLNIIFQLSSLTHHLTFTSRRRYRHFQIILFIDNGGVLGLLSKQTQ